MFDETENDTIEDVQDQINYHCKIYSIIDVPTSFENGIRTIQFNDTIDIGGVTIPRYAKGILVSTGQDATMYVIDNINTMYYGYYNSVTGLWNFSISQTVDKFDPPCINDMYDPPAGISLYNCEGTIISNNIMVSYNGKKALVYGRCVIDMTSRLGSNPGFKITLPKGKMVDKSCSSRFINKFIYSDKFSQEYINLETTDGSSDIVFRVSESLENTSTGRLMFAIPPTYIRIK